MGWVTVFFEIARFPQPARPDYNKGLKIMEASRHMNRLKSIYRTLSCWALFLGFWLALEMPVWAKPPTKAVEEESGGGGAWVPSYFLVLLCVALGMLIICRTSQRSERARPQQYEALKTAD